MRLNPSVASFRVRQDERTSSKLKRLGPTYPCFLQLSLDKMWLCVYIDLKTTAESTSANGVLSPAMHVVLRGAHGCNMLSSTSDWNILTEGDDLRFSVSKTHHDGRSIQAFGCGLHNVSFRYEFETQKSFPLSTLTIHVRSGTVGNFFGIGNFLRLSRLPPLLTFGIRGC